MCGVCHEGIAYMCIRKEINKKKVCEGVIPYYNYAQETNYLSDLAKSSDVKKYIDEMLHVFFIRALEDIIFQKKIDYFDFDEQVLLPFAEKQNEKFENYQKKIDWLKLWRFIFEKKSLTDLQRLESCLRNDKLKDYVMQPLEFYLDKFTGEPEIEEPKCYGEVYEEGKEPEDVKKYSEYYHNLCNELYFLYPVFHCCLIYAAAHMKNIDILWKITCSEPICLIDFYGLDLWLRRRAIFYLIDLNP